MSRRRNEIQLMKLAMAELVRPPVHERRLPPALCYAAEPRPLSTPSAQAMHASLSHFGPLPPDHVPSGPAIFNAMISHPDYYLIKAEHAAAMAHREQISDILRGKCVVELGVGDGRKTRQLFERFGAPAYAVLNDVSREHLQTAREQVGAVVGEENIRTVIRDFTDPGFKDMTFWREAKKSGLPLLLLMPGSTLQNFSADAAKALWKGIGHHFDEALFAMDSTQDTAMIAQAYGKPVAPVAMPFYLGGLALSFDLLYYDLDPALLHRRFSYVGFRDDARHCYSIGLVCCESHTAALSQHARQFAALSSDTVARNRVDFEKGEVIRSIDTHKWPAAFRDEVLTAAGHRIAAVMPFAAALKADLPDIEWPFRSELKNSLIDYNWIHLTR